MKSVCALCHMFIKEERMLQINDSMQSVGFPEIENLQTNWNNELNSMQCLISSNVSMIKVKLLFFL